MALHLLKTTRVRATTANDLTARYPEYSGRQIRSLTDADYAALLRAVAHDAARRDFDSDLTLSDLAAGA